MCCVFVDEVPASFRVLRGACSIEPLRCCFVLGVVLSGWRSALVVFGCVCNVDACMGLDKISTSGESVLPCVCGVYPAWTMRLSM